MTSKDLFYSNGALVMAFYRKPKMFTPTYMSRALDILYGTLLGRLLA